MENDLIHRNTALAILRALREAVGNYAPVDDIDDAIDMIQNVNAVAAQPKWISVEERLPEQEGMYIVYIERNKGNAFIGTDHYDFLNRWGGEGWYDGRYVTHWMPFDSLPEPPKEEA